jgi:hypothetical protein
MVRECQNFEQVVQDMQEKLDKERSDSDKLRSYLNEQVEPRETLFANGVGQLSDSVIARRWKQLCFNVRQCVADINPPGRGKSVQGLGVFESLTSEYLWFLADKNRCIFLGEAVVWDVLSAWVFASKDRPSHMRWAGKFSGAMGPMCECAPFSISSKLPD